MSKRVLGVLLTVLICVVGCFAQAAPDAALVTGINMFMDCFAALEEMFMAQLDVIHAAQTFLDTPDARQREALDQAGADAHAQLSSIRLPPAAMEPAVYKALLENDIDPSMFEALVTYSGYQLETLFASVTTQATIPGVFFDAGEAGVAREYLQYTLAYIQSEMRGTYYDINAIFIGLDGEVLAYVKESVARRLPNLSALGLPWENDLMAIMEKQTLELDLMTEQTDALEAFVNEQAWILSIDEKSMETYWAVAALLERRTVENSSFACAIDAARCFVCGDQTQAQARQAVALSMNALSRENEENALLAITNTFEEMAKERATLTFYLELLYTLLEMEDVDAQTVQAMTDILERYHAARTQAEIALVHEFALLEAADAALFKQMAHSAFAAFAGDDDPWADDIGAMLTQHLAALEAMQQALEALRGLVEEIWGA